MNTLLLIKLLAAHIIGDFFLQTDKICNGKKTEGVSRFKYLIIHTGINGALAYVFAGMWKCWQIPVAIFLTHFLIDLIKSYVKSQSIWVFTIDQLAHIVVIGFLWLWITGSKFCFGGDWVSDYRIWVVAVCYLLVMKPASILLGLFIAKWTPKKKEKDSLPNAGAWIGYLERVLILSFMLIGFMEGIGFLLAAKSIFRFGELTKAPEVKLTEYVMIGTLSSFSIAIIIGVVALKVLSM